MRLFIVINFDHVGHFNNREGDTWWAGLAPNQALLTMQNDLAKQLRLEGFALENRRFSPHITLARRMKLQTAPDKATLLAEPILTDGREISLMLSERINGKLTYTPQYVVSANKLS